MKDINEFFAYEGDYADLDVDGACKRLSRAIQFKTIDMEDVNITDYNEFDGMHAHMKESYPHVMAASAFEVFKTRSILITIPGTNPELKPVMFMSHQDVVPVVEGTEKDWKYPPFSGTIADGVIWGRGSFDIKDQVFATLEAMEYLLAHGKKPARTTYLAFGDDEENLQQGAKDVARVLKERGVELEFLLDEGGWTINTGDAFGAPHSYVAQVGLMEKGYADLILETKSKGGHSSRPFGGTSLGRLSQAIAKIVENPMPIKLTPVMINAWKSIAPYVTEEPLKTYVQDVEANVGLLAEYCSKNAELFPYVQTTCAPTMMLGTSKAPNVMPQDMTAWVNFRINEGETKEQLLEHVIEVVNDPLVDIHYHQANDPSNTAKTDGFGYAKLIEAMTRYYKDVVFIPSMFIAATDARNYEIVCDTCLRCSPFMETPEEVNTGVHGTNEHISVRCYAQGIRILIYMMEQTLL